MRREQPQSHRHRPEQDEPAHPEPTAPAAEHVAWLPGALTVEQFEALTLEHHHSQVMFSDE